MSRMVAARSRVASGWLSAHGLLAQSGSFLPGYGIFDAVGEAADHVGEAEEGVNGKVAATRQAQKHQSVEAAKLKFEANPLGFELTVEFWGKRGDDASQAVNPGKIAAQFDHVKVNQRAALSAHTLYHRF